jgi:hypothetical protein
MQLEKNLPAVTAGALKKRLEEVESLEIANKTLQQHLTSSQDSNFNYAKQVTAKLEIITELTKQLEEFKLREVHYKESESVVQSAQLSQKVAEAKLEGAMEVTRLVFGNIKLRERIYGTEPVAIPPAVKDQYGNTQYGSVGQGSVDKTKETAV